MAGWGRNHDYNDYTGVGSVRLVWGEAIKWVGIIGVMMMLATAAIGQAAAMTASKHTPFFFVE